MITPTRFGLKYAPVPTLALEYEVNVDGDDGTEGGTTSLYVYDRHASSTSSATRVKKLHVVELPALTRQSEAAVVARQLQQANRRFLAPDIVKEEQLVRLLERLTAHAQAAELSVSPSLLAAGASAAAGGDGAGRTTIAAASSGMFRSHDDDGQHENGDDEEELEESAAMDESIAEASASMEASNRSDDQETRAAGGSSAFKVVSSSNTITIEVSSKANESTPTPSANTLAHEKGAANDDGNDEDGYDEETSRREAEADAAKLAALRADDDASDGEEAVSEEDIQSEELEYFSEDGSDEDSF